MKKDPIIKITQIGILSAISSILYLPFFSFPVSFLFPEFLKIQFSNLPAIIGGFAIGPIEGCIIILIKTVIKIFFVNTNTAYVGELADVLIGVSVILISSIIYQKWHNKKGAVIGLSTGCILWVIISMITNWLILVPFYIENFMGGNLSVFINACSIIPGINESNYMKYYLLLSVLPFNIILSSLNAFITYFVYKRISVIFKKMDEK